MDGLLHSRYREGQSHWRRAIVTDPQHAEEQGVRPGNGGNTVNTGGAGNSFGTKIESLNRRRGPTLAYRNGER